MAGRNALVPAGVAFLVAMALTVFMAVFAAALFAPSAGAAEIAPEPNLTAARAKSENCVADTEFMRKNHMKMLLHQRKETVHEGIRTKQFSLKECIDCHAVPGSDGKPVKVSNPQHFCRTCHDFAAVKVDCFECHASTPESGEETAAAPEGTMPADHADMAALADYLRKVDQ